MKKAPTNKAPAKKSVNSLSKVINSKEESKIAPREESKISAKEESKIASKPK